MDRVKWNPRIYTVYPKFATELFRAMMNERGAPKEHVRRLARRAQAAAGLSSVNLARDGFDLLRGL